MNKVYIINFTRTITDGDMFNSKNTHICGVYSSAEVACKKIAKECDTLCKVFTGCARTTNNHYGTKWYRDCVKYTVGSLTEECEYKISERTLDEDYNVL